MRLSAVERRVAISPLPKKEERERKKKARKRKARRINLRKNKRRMTFSVMTARKMLPPLPNQLSLKQRRRSLLLNQSLSLMLRFTSRRQILMSFSQK